MTLRTLLHTINVRTINYPHEIEACATDTHALKKALYLIPAVYFYLLYQAFSNFAQWTSHPLNSATQYQPIWSIQWLSGVSFENTILIVMSMSLIGMLLASIFFGSRWARLAAFIGFFIYHAFLNSFGSPQHAELVWLYPLFFLIFLPDLWNKATTSTHERKAFLIGFLTVQVYIGIIYTLAGIGKVYRGIFQLAAGQANFLSPDAFALHIANWLPVVGSDSVLGPLVVSHPIFGWPFFLIMLYFQCFTLWAIFRPSLHRVWGAVLICFHIATFLTMNILFINSIFLLAILLLNSPFEQPGTTWRQRFDELPIFGWILRRIILVTHSRGRG